LLHGARRLRTECVAEAEKVPASSEMNLVRIEVGARVGRAVAEQSSPSGHQLAVPLPGPDSPGRSEDTGEIRARQGGLNIGEVAVGGDVVRGGDVVAPFPTAPDRRMQSKASSQPISAMAYAGIALVGLLFALGFTFFYIYQVPKLVEGGAQGQVFYLLLIPWALSSAAFLFGAMRSYAHFTQRPVGSLLELGGPVVLFGLVLLGGFKLVPAAPETFDLAVRAHSADTPLITSGQITLELPGLPHANIGQDGEANFKGLSAQLKGKAIRVLPKVDGYEEKWLTPTIDGNILTVELEKAHPVFLQRATLVPPPKGKSIQIRVDGQKIEATIDELGGFTFTASGKAGDRVLVEVFVNQEMASSEYHVLSTHPIDIHWTSPSEKPKR
jgi:hypothetical protein